MNLKNKPLHFRAIGLRDISRFVHIRVELLRKRLSTLLETRLNVLKLSVGFIVDKYSVVLHHEVSKIS